MQEESFANQENKTSGYDDDGSYSYRKSFGNVNVNANEIETKHLVSTRGEMNSCQQVDVKIYQQQTPNDMRTFTSNSNTIHHKDYRQQAHNYDMQHSQDMNRNENILKMDYNLRERYEEINLQELKEEQQYQVEYKNQNVNIVKDCFGNVNGGDSNGHFRQKISWDGSVGDFNEIDTQNGDKFDNKTHNSNQSRAVQSIQFQSDHVAKQAQQPTKQLSESHIIFLFDTIRQTLSHRPLHQVLHILYKKHVLKLPQQEIFSSQQLLKTESKYFLASTLSNYLDIKGGRRSQANSDRHNNGKLMTAASDLRDVGMSFITYGFDGKTRMRHFPFMSQDRYQHLVETIAQLIWMEVSCCVGEQSKQINGNGHSSCMQNGVQQLTVSQVKLMRRQVIMKYKEWMAPQLVMTLSQIGKAVIDYYDMRSKDSTNDGHDANDKSGDGSIISKIDRKRVINLYTGMVSRLKQKQQLQYRRLMQQKYRNIKKASSSINNNHNIMISSSRDFNNQDQNLNNSYENRRNIYDPNNIRINGNNSDNNKYIELQQQQEFLINSNCIGNRNTNGKQYYVSPIIDQKHKLCTKANYDSSVNNGNNDNNNNKKNLSNNVDAADLRRQMKMQQKIKEKLDLYNKEKLSSSNNQPQLLDWNTVKASTTNGIPRIETFKNSNQKMRLKRGEQLRVMDYDEEKSVEDFDDIIRDTNQQGSLAAYSKTYRKKQRPLGSSINEGSRPKTDKHKQIDTINDHHPQGEVKLALTAENTKRSTHAIQYNTNNNSNTNKKQQIKQLQADTNDTANANNNSNKNSNNNSDNNALTVSKVQHSESLVNQQPIQIKLENCDGNGKNSNNNSNSNCNNNSNSKKPSQFTGPPTQEYWTEDNTKLFIQFYCQKPTLNNVRDCFNQLQQDNNIHFEYKHIKSKFGKLMRISIRNLITRRQKLQHQCQTQGLKCSMPLIYKLRDDKIKCIISTPNAEQLRLKIFKLYLADQNDIAMLQDTIYTCNQFIESMFGPLDQFEPINSEYSPLSYLSAKSEKMNFLKYNNFNNNNDDGWNQNQSGTVVSKHNKIKIKTPAQQLNEDYRMCVQNGRLTEFVETDNVYNVDYNGNQNGNNYSSKRFIEEMTQVDQMINYQSRRLGGSKSHLHLHAAPYSYGQKKGRK